MVTKAQAVIAGGTGADIHVGICTRRVGPRGGVTESITRVRPSGRCQTWITRPDEFRLPVKFGLYQHGEITQRNAGDFHFVFDCPLALAQQAVVDLLDAEENGPRKPIRTGPNAMPGLRGAK